MQISTNKGQLEAFIKVNLDEFAEAFHSDPVLVKSLLPMQTQSDSPKPSKRPRTASESPPVPIQSNFSICISGKYGGPGTCKAPIIDFVLGQGDQNFSKVDLPHCLQGCWKLKQVQVAAAAVETDATLELPDTGMADMSQMQSLVSQGRLHARFWNAKFDTEDPAVAIVVWTLDVGQSDDRVKVFLDSRQLNDDELHQLFAEQFPELMFDDTVQTGPSSSAGELCCQLACRAGQGATMQTVAMSFCISAHMNLHCQVGNANCMCINRTFNQAAVTDKSAQCGAIGTATDMQIEILSACPSVRNKLSISLLKV